MPKLVAAIPNPVSAPHARERSRGGCGPITYENAAAAKIAKTRLTPNTFAGCPGGGGAPFSRFHARPKSAGEYHNPPSRKLETAATRMGQGFMRAVLSEWSGRRPH